MTLIEDLRYLREDASILNFNHPDEADCHRIREWLEELVTLLIRVVEDTEK